MKYEKYISAFDKVSASNKILTFIVFLIGALVVVNTIATFFLSARERIILVPPGLQEKAQITESKVDEHYLKAFSRYALGLLLNYTPFTAKQQFEELLLLYDVDSYPASRTQFFNLADMVNTSQVSSVFQPQKFVVDQSNSWIKVQGARKIYKDDRSSTSSLQVYQMYYKMSNSRFYIIEIKEVEHI